MDVKLLNVCRACMVDSENTMQQNGFTKMTSEIIQMFTLCTTLKVAEKDGLPSKICMQCVNRIDSCYRFINVCKVTDTTLRGYLERGGNPSADEIFPIKEEFIVENNLKDENSLAAGKNLNSSDDNLNKIKNDPDVPEEFKFEVEFNDDDSNGNISNDSEKLTNLIGLNNKKRKRTKKDEYKTKIKKSKFKKVSKPIKELKKKEYSCPVCEKTIFGKKEYNTHLADQHEDYKKYICAHCNKGFPRSDYLKQHLVNHTDERPLTCTKCPKTFKEHRQLRRHLRLHNTERPYSCDKCGMSFSMKYVLVNHSRLHQGEEQNLCHLCGASFALASNLVVHMRIHTGEKPYACSLCPFRCAVQSGLRRHERTHTNLRTHVCSVCQKGFNNSSSLVRHLRIHTGELPYKCDYCSKSFIDNWKRKNHLSKAHNVSIENMPRMIPGRKRSYVKKDMELKEPAS